VIKSFRGKVAEKVFNREHAPRFPAGLYRAAQRKLAILDAAMSLNDLKVPPGNQLEKLKKTARASTLSGSMTSGASASNGVMAMPTMWR